MTEICPCCEQPCDSNYLEHLEKHHWYETDGTIHFISICHHCNTVLQSGYFGIVQNHVLPSWEVQVNFVRERFLASWLRKKAKREIHRKIGMSMKGMEK